MTKLIQYLYSLLSAITEKLYLESAPQGTTFPYVTFSLPSSADVGLREDVILEVNIWDNIPDTTRLETLAEAIDTALQRLKHIDGNMQISIYRVGRYMIPDSDESVKRRQLRYQIKTYTIN